MGIHNFKCFLNGLDYRVTSSLQEFDSIFIDIQSLLYRAIAYSFKKEEPDLKEDISLIVSQDLCKLLDHIFSFNKFKDEVKILISFDGESIPMKFPTQKQRRSANVEGRNLYKVVLFGHNTISDQICRFLVDMLTNHTWSILPTHVKLPTKLEFLIMGSDTKGEGEHKLFLLGSHLNCRNPIIASVDNDVFIIALSQLSKFDSIQIYKNNYNILNVNEICSRFMKYDKTYCIFTSLLFGNDFIPPVINLTESNSPIIHRALSICKYQHMPHVFHTVLHALKEESKIRFQKPPQIEESIVLEFWKNCLWVIDYYKHYDFPQKYAENKLFDEFEKNHIIAALLDEGYSEESYKKAFSNYKTLNTQPYTLDAKNSVFTEEQLKQYDKFFPKKNSAECYRTITVKIEN